MPMAGARARPARGCSSATCSGVAQRIHSSSSGRPLVEDDQAAVSKRSGSITLVIPTAREAPAACGRRGRARRFGVEAQARTAAAGHGGRAPNGPDACRCRPCGPRAKAIWLRAFSRLDVASGPARPARRSPRFAPAMEINGSPRGSTIAAAHVVGCVVE